MAGEGFVDKKIDAKEYIRTVFHIGDGKILDRFAAVAELRTVQKGEHLFLMGETSPYVYVLLSGVLQGYFLDAEGEQVTYGFWWESGSLICGNPKLDEPSKVNAACIADCRLLAFPADVVMGEVARSLELALLFIERQNVALNVRMEEKMICHYHSPMKRYLWMKKTYPGWEGMIQDRYLANFLGMTPVTLCRIKRRVHNGEIGE